MIIQLNKHGPLGGLMQGDIHNRGSSPSFPVLSPYTMVVKPPGCQGRSNTVAAFGRNLHLKLPTLKTGPQPAIALRLPVTSHPGKPTIILLQTHQPGNTLPGETQHSCCNRMILPSFSYQLTATCAEQRSSRSISYQLFVPHQAEQVTRNPEHGTLEHWNAGTAFRQAPCAKRNTNNLPEEKVEEVSHFVRDDRNPMEQRTRNQKQKSTA